MSSLYFPNLVILLTFFPKPAAVFTGIYYDINSPIGRFCHTELKMLLICEMNVFMTSFQESDSATAGAQTSTSPSTITISPITLHQKM